MDSIDELIQYSSIGELECGCFFDCDGVRPVGQWLTCHTHRAWARLVRSRTVTNSGALIA